jgi:hypothetical protein
MDRVRVARVLMSDYGISQTSLPVKLTRAGKRLFKHADDLKLNKLKLSVTGFLFPAANPTITVSEHKAFTLKR